MVKADHARGVAVAAIAALFSAPHAVALPPMPLKMPRLEESLAVEGDSQAEKLSIFSALPLGVRQAIMARVEERLDQLDDPFFIAMTRFTGSAQVGDLPLYAPQVVVQYLEGGNKRDFVGTSANGESDQTTGALPFALDVKYVDRGLYRTELTSQDLYPNLQFRAALNGYHSNTALWLATLLKELDNGQDFFAGDQLKRENGFYLDFSKLLDTRLPGKSCTIDIGLRTADYTDTTWLDLAFEPFKAIVEKHFGEDGKYPTGKIWSGQQDKRFILLQVFLSYRIFRQEREASALAWVLNPDDSFPASYKSFEKRFGPGTPKEKLSWREEAIVWLGDMPDFFRQIDETKTALIRAPATPPSGGIVAGSQPDFYRAAAASLAQRGVKDHPDTLDTLAVLNERWRMRNTLVALIATEELANATR